MGWFSQFFQERQHTLKILKMPKSMINQSHYNLKNFNLCQNLEELFLCGSYMHYEDYEIIAHLTKLKKLTIESIISEHLIGRNYFQNVTWPALERLWLV